MPDEISIGGVCRLADRGVIRASGADAAIFLQGQLTNDVASLTPLYGHPWLLASALGKGLLPAPWLAQGARETMPPPGIRDFLSPLLLRFALGLPPVSPLTPRLLSRTAVAYAIRGRPREARRFADEALVLDPTDEQARDVLRTTPKGD